MALCEMTNYDDYSVKWMRNGSREISDENLAIYPARASVSSRNWFDYRPRMRSALHHRERDCACPVIELHHRERDCACPVSYIIGNEAEHARCHITENASKSNILGCTSSVLIQLPSFSFLGVGCLPGWPPFCLLACLERTWIEDPQRAG